MQSFYTTCIMGFPVEDCSIYNIQKMWKIILLQSVLCSVVIGIKIVMIRRAYALYLNLHELKSPLLRVILQDKRVISPMVVGNRMNEWMNEWMNIWLYRVQSGIKRREEDWHLRKVEIEEGNWIYWPVSCNLWSLQYRWFRSPWTELQQGRRQQGRLQTQQNPPTGTGILSLDCSSIMNTSSLNL